MNKWGKGWAKKERKWPKNRIVFEQGSDYRGSSKIPEEDVSRIVVEAEMLMSRCRSESIC